MHLGGSEYARSLVHGVQKNTLSYSTFGTELQHSLTEHTRTQVICLNTKVLNTFTISIDITA